MRTPFAPHAGGHSLGCYVLSDATDGIDVQPKDVGHVHTCRQLGIDQLGHHQPPRGAVIRRPLDQRHRPQKNRMTPALRFLEQAQPAAKQDARRRNVVQPRQLIQRWPGG